VSPNLLATKLYIPTVRKDLVPRPRLVQLLNNAWQQDKKLILVSAPAGYGKTTLITEWLSGLQTKTAWLSLDKTDNDPARFLAYQALLQSQQPLPVELMLTSLVNEITIVPSPFILVLDDYHVIQAMPIHQQLDFLVEHQPPQMHLVIITREDPPLPLARLWAHGRMAEIRQDELRFSQEECSDFLKRQMGLHLSLEDITALERRTEGWIAGLQLAALSMQGCDDLPSFVRAFSGSSHYVLEYLLEEVFERQSAEEQDFLFKNIHPGATVRIAV
jgi:LuxR family maltose regulon positive regulatory protein